METLVMKRAWLTATLAAGLLQGFQVPSNKLSQQQTLITGRISPADAAEVAWIMSARDTVKTIIRWGNFSQLVKPGHYKLIVSARPPYQNVCIGNLVVRQNHALNVGELILDK